MPQTETRTISRLNLKQAVAAAIKNVNVPPGTDADALLKVGAEANRIAVGVFHDHAVEDGPVGCLTVQAFNLSPDYDSLTDQQTDIAYAFDEAMNEHGFAGFVGVVNVEG